MKKIFFYLSLLFINFLTIEFHTKAAEPAGPPKPSEWREPYYIPMRVQRGGGTYQIMARYDCPKIHTSPLKSLISRLAIARNTNSSDSEKAHLVREIATHKAWIGQPLYYQCGDEQGTFIPGPTPAQYAKELHFTNAEIKIFFDIE